MANGGITPLAADAGHAADTRVDAVRAELAALKLAYAKLEDERKHASVRDARMVAASTSTRLQVCASEPL